MVSEIIVYLVRRLRTWEKAKDNQHGFWNVAHIKPGKFLCFIFLKKMKHYVMQAVSSYSLYSVFSVQCFIKFIIWVLVMLLFLYWGWDAWGCCYFSLKKTYFFKILYDKLVILSPFLFPTKKRKEEKEKIKVKPFFNLFFAIPKTFTKKVRSFRARIRP